MIIKYVTLQLKYCLKQTWNVKKIFTILFSFNNFISNHPRVWGIFFCFTVLSAVIQLCGENFFSGLYEICISRILQLPWNIRIFYFLEKIWTFFKLRTRKFHFPIYKKFFRVVFFTFWARSFLLKCKKFFFWENVRNFSEWIYFYFSTLGWKVRQVYIYSWVHRISFTYNPTASFFGHRIVQWL